MPVGWFSYQFWISLHAVLPIHSRIKRDGITLLSFNWFCTIEDTTSEVMSPQWDRGSREIWWKCLITIRGRWMVQPISRQFVKPWICSCNLQSTGKATFQPIYGVPVFVATLPFQFPRRSLQKTKLKSEIKISSFSLQWLNDMEGPVKK